jgi:Cu-Zn family superoxide dismutase
MGSYQSSTSNNSNSNSKSNNNLGFSNAQNSVSTTVCTNTARNAICVLDKNKPVTGIISFHQCSPHDIVRVRFTLYGQPNQVHAIHIHEYGDTTDGCKSLGEHFNPYSQMHGSYLYPNQGRHVGDLINNIRFDKYGQFFFEYDDPLLSLMQNDRSYVVGRSVVIHGGIDDLGQGQGPARKESLTTGNAGERINYGLIVLSKTKHF